MTARRCSECRHFAAVPRNCIDALKRRLAAAELQRDALAGENERLRAALDAAKAESARLREDLRIVSRYAARLYDGMVNMVEAIDENAGRVWHAALKRGREGR